MTGDEPCYEELRADWVKRDIGDALPANVPLAEVVRDVKKSFHPFFLVPDPQRFEQCGAHWKESLGSGAIALASPEDTCPVAAGIVALSERAVPGLDALGTRLLGAGYSTVRTAGILNALKDWAISNGTP